MVSVARYARPMASTVVLRHEMPDGSHHFDWLFERPGLPGSDPDDRVLVAFRLREPPSGVTTLDADRLADHRRLYLHYEGPISAGRGDVYRVEHGECEILRDDDAGFEVLVSLGDSEQPDLWVGLPVAGPVWRLVKHNPVGR